MKFVRDNISRLAGYVPGEQPQAGKFIKLNTNENPYPPSAKVVEAIQVAAEKLVRYPDPVSTAFRLAAGEALNVDPEWIICGNGSDDILTILTRSFVDQGDLIRLPNPSYILYRTLAEIQGANYQEVNFNDDWSLPESFSAADVGLKLVFLPNPNSPTGSVVSQEAILDLAERLPCPILIDEAYVDFADFNCIELVKQNSKIMVSRTLSKSYGLAGLRFGFLVAQPTIIQQLLKVKDSYNCDALSIAGATAAISDQQWLQENVAKIKSTRQLMQEKLTQLGFDIIPSQANFVWCTHPTAQVKSIYEYLKENRILVRYMSYPNWEEGLRISVGTDEQINACLSLIQSKV
ncbi:MAG: histidinol-phosphate transaminase [Planctomycetaceae bacterium]|nr:histidinol-phosphate transaminase [Planctomycetaceae bacterium]|tara:strand:- start:765 stop:1808 length:1044 start_codon:yes stop_codon:yes gene_type:complete